MPVVALAPRRVWWQDLRPGDGMKVICSYAPASQSTVHPGYEPISPHGVRAYPLGIYEILPANMPNEIMKRGSSTRSSRSCRLESPQILDSSGGR